jgi:hypothetical protein
MQQEDDQLTHGGIVARSPNPPNAPELPFRHAQVCEALPPHSLENVGSTVLHIISTEIKPVDWFQPLTCRPAVGMSRRAGFGLLTYALAAHAAKSHADAWLLVGSKVRAEDEGRGDGD